MELLGRWALLRREVGPPDGYSGVPAMSRASPARPLRLVFSPLSLGRRRGHDRLSTKSWPPRWSVAVEHPCPAGSSCRLWDLGMSELSQPAHVQGYRGDEPVQCGSVGFRLVGFHPHFLFALLTPLTRGLLQPMFSTSPRNAGLFGGRFGYHSFVQAYGNIVRSVANFRCFDQPLPGRRCRFQETVPHGHFTVSGFPFLGFFSSSLRQEEHTNSPCRSLNASTTGRKSSFSMFSQLL